MMPVRSTVHTPVVSRVSQAIDHLISDISLILCVVTYMHTRSHSVTKQCSHGLVLNNVVLFAISDVSKFFFGDLRPIRHIKENITHSLTHAIQSIP